MNNKGRPRKYTPEKARQININNSIQWNKQHKESAYRNQKKSRAKNFLLNDARIDELNYFSELINNRMQELKNNNSN
ncbi:hypothetical protein [Limosilactobacillus reuteri]|uniref:hypothetical protein n=1 Tax=Limosilactobacillus reuteri TaxID=1598 RepID=UPI002B053918|nr:hypothetical protein [Limosilactobacillus reuteri]